MTPTFHQVVTKWDELCSALGPWEPQHLTNDDNEFALKQHFRRVNDLLSKGRQILGVTDKPEFPDKALVAHIQARIRHLEDKLALWHREMDPAEQERILAVAFN
jgi:hypothetical protein